MQGQADIIAALQRQIEDNTKQITALLGRPVEVQAGETTVNVPATRKPSSFHMEHPDGSETIVTPQYERVN